jgi:hypothetical protein
MAKKVEQLQAKLLRYEQQKIVSPAALNLKLPHGSESNNYKIMDLDVHLANNGRAAASWGSPPPTAAYLGGGFNLHSSNSAPQAQNGYPQNIVEKRGQHPVDDLPSPTPHTSNGNEQQWRSSNTNNHSDSNPISRNCWCYVEEQGELYCHYGPSASQNNSNNFFG